MAWTGNSDCAWVLFFFSELSIYGSVRCGSVRRLVNVTGKNRRLLSIYQRTCRTLACIILVKCTHLLPLFYSHPTSRWKKRHKWFWIRPFVRYWAALDNVWLVTRKRHYFDLLWIRCIFVVLYFWIQQPGDAGYNKWTTNRSNGV